MTEPAADRFDRDWEHQLDDRKDRGLNHMSPERAARLYVNKETGTTPADDENVFPD